MGTFAGHAIPGTFFLLYGFWWTTQIIRNGLKARVYNRAFRSTASFRCPCCPNVPIEGILKIILSSIGITGEMMTAFRHGEFVNIGNGQHITMYAFAFVSGAVDLVVHYKPRLLPPDADYVSLCLAMMAEAILFALHLHGRTHMDVQLHHLFLLVVVADAVFTWYEMQRRDQLFVALGRAYFTILQGTWMWQVGAILYPPLEGMAPWDQGSHSQMMITAMMFTWHMAGVFVTMFGAYAFSSWCVYRDVPMADVADNGQALVGQTAKNGGLLCNHERLLESDSETEYHKLDLVQVTSQ